MTAPVLSVKDLVVEFPTHRGTLRALDGVSFEVGPGEILGVVGESGAGKSITGCAIMGLLAPPGRIASGEIRLRGERIDNITREEMHRIRGKRIGMVFQNPMTSLNPLFTVGRQLAETIEHHLGLGARPARKAAIELLAEVGIPAPEARIDNYPHQFSGGMRQRVVIALALCSAPDFVIADEPTTALDVSVQAQIMLMFRRLCRERQASAILISHDFGVIAEAADRVAVLYAGRVFETGAVRSVLERPLHPYTRALIGSVPSLTGNDNRLVQIPGSMPGPDAVPEGCAFHPRCPHAMDTCRRERPPRVQTQGALLTCWVHSAAPGKPLERPSMAGQTPLHPIRGNLPAADPLVQVLDITHEFDVSAPWLHRILSGEPRRVLRAVDRISFDIRRGETLALVGESGSGKSTIAKIIVGLLPPGSGTVRVDGVDIWDPANVRWLKSLRRRFGMIFQDPGASLNPRWRVRAIVAEPLECFGLTRGRDTSARVDELLATVRLNPADGEKYPHQFSGGQRQRIAIARALASEPAFLVCDEPTSSLDVSVQAQILNLMRDLQERLGLSYLFISHNLAVVRHMADRIGVLYLGRLAEIAPAKEMFRNPRHPYTRSLIDAIPDIGMNRRERQLVRGEVPNPINPPPGCAFHPRCPSAHDVCRREAPLAFKEAPGRIVACHGVLRGWISQPGRQPAGGAAPTRA